jgi:glycosyltransferase involved in cell wall biosynthesis
MKPMPIPVSAIVLTKNEEENLPDCLASLRWADEIVVVDSFSTDRTVAIAQQHGARVVQHPFQDYAAQHNFAQTQAQHNWVLFVDADERVSPELAQEIRQLADSEALAQNNAYHIERLHLISGRWLFSDPARRKLTPRYQAHLRRVENPRLVDRRQAVWERPLHEIVRAPEPHGVLSGVIYHYANTNLSATFESFNSYTDREADYLYRTLKRNRVSVVEALYRGVRTFLYLYVWWGWWKLGEQGLLMALINGCTKFVNYAKLGERLRIANDQGLWTERDRQLLKQFEAAHPDRSAEDQT